MLTKSNKLHKRVISFLLQDQRMKALGFDEAEIAHWEEDCKKIIRETSHTSKS